MEQTVQAAQLAGLDLVVAGLAAHTMAQTASVTGLGGIEGPTTGWAEPLGGLDLASVLYVAHPCSLL